MARRTNAQIRQDTFEEIQRKDGNRRVVQRPAAIKKPRAGYRNPKPREVEIVCCLDKPRPLPVVFKQCPDCPKLTEAESLPEVVAQTTEAGTKSRRGAKSTRGGSKPRRGSKPTGAGSTTD
jgi:hypothetical protein